MQARKTETSNRILERRADLSVRRASVSIVAHIICFTNTNAVSTTARYELTNNINKYKMRTTLTILIRLLVADFGAQHIPQHSLGLTEAQTCKFQVLWVETRLMSEYLRCLMPTLAILVRTTLSPANQAVVVGGDFSMRDKELEFLLTFYVGKNMLNKILIIAEYFYIQYFKTWLEGNFK